MTDNGLCIPAAGSGRRFAAPADVRRLWSASRLRRGVSRLSCRFRAGLALLLVLCLSGGAALADESSVADSPSKASGRYAENHQGKAGINGFGANPFALEHRKLDNQKKPDKKRLYYGPDGVQEKPLALGDDERVTLRGKSTTAPDDRLMPNRNAFSGGKSTLSRMDNDPPPEFSMDYKLKGNATTRLTVNPQDTGSPLPRPAEQGNNAINSAGVYMQMDVAPDLQLRIGGEYSDIDDPRVSNSSSSRGASIGLKLDF